MREETDVQGLIRTADLVKDLELVARSPKAFEREVLQLWQEGLRPGSRPGWPSVNRFYTVARGQFTVLTGWPSSGKSEWLDAVLINLAKEGWRFAMFSPENQPEQLHLAKLLEKHLGMPFADGPTARMNEDEVREGLDSINEWFGFLGPSAITDRTCFSIEQVLGAAEVHFRMAGIWGKREVPLGLVIDPWNELEHLRPQHMTETDYISITLQSIRAWARKNGVHVWIVAHPRKAAREDGKLPIPTPDLISGSQRWWDKADCCVCVWRDFANPDSPEVQIHVQKVRFRHVGRIGMAKLNYNRVTGRYSEIAPSVAVVGGRDA